jgi:hypothetical protein
MSNNTCTTIALQHSAYPRSFLLISILKFVLMLKYRRAKWREVGHEFKKFCPMSVCLSVMHEFGIRKLKNKWSSTELKLTVYLGPGNK